MDEIEYKLSENNAVIIVQAITKLLDIIKRKKLQQPNRDNDSNFAELHFLKSKCIIENTVISVTACHGIVSLVEEGILAVTPTISDLMILSSNAKSYGGIIMATGNLLLLDLRRTINNNEKYQCVYNIQKPQHPFITVLSQNPDVWFDVYNQIQLFLNHYDNRIVENSLELLRPVLLYVLCNPYTKLMPTFRKQLWSLLNSNFHKKEVKNFITEILTWIPMNSRQDCLELSNILIELSKITIQNVDTEISTLLVLHLTIILYKLIQDGFDPTVCVDTLIKLLDLQEMEVTHNILLFMLAEIITISPSIYLNEVLRLCNTIVRKQSSNLLATKAIVASILQWILYPSTLLSNGLTQAKEILAFIENNNTETKKSRKIQSFEFSEQKIDFAYKMSLLATKLKSDEDQLTWLEQIEDNKTILFKMYHFLTAMFINERNGIELNLKLLQTLEKFLENSKEYASKLLILILYKLSNESEPILQIRLFQSIPLMAVSKQNIPLIINTFETTMKGSETLKTFVLDLYLRLWKTEVRCFPYLQKLLFESDLNWEDSVTKAFTLKSICVHRPELYGKEMVLHLSQMLNKFNDCTVLTLAIDGITELCQAEIVDVLSIWRNIKPRFVTDTRPQVINSLCNFFVLYASLDRKYPEHESAVDEAITILWQYVSTSEDTEVIKTALKALTHFDLEQIKFDHLPDKYKQNVTLKSDDSPFTYIPGICWIQFLQNVNPGVINEAGDLLTSWVRKEIIGYRNVVYAVKGEGVEPNHYNLPKGSIVQILTNFIRDDENNKFKYSVSVLKQCLRILGASFPKPLPPLNWCFLHELLHKDADISQLCINLACKQIIISGSARRLIENYIHVFEPNNEKINEILILFTNLKHLFKVMEPNLLETLIKKYLKFLLEEYKQNNTETELFSIFVDETKNYFVSDDMSETKMLLGQIIEEFSEQLNANDKLFDILLPCIIEIPAVNLKRLNVPSSIERKYEKALKICCALVLKNKNSSLNQINECIYYAATFPSVQNYALDQLKNVFRYHIENSMISNWLLELMFHIQGKLIEDKMNMNKIIFLFDVFISAIVIITGYDLLQMNDSVSKLDLFPCALQSLIREKYTHTSVQVLEWLFHMTDVCTIPKYRMVFYQSLIALQHEKTFCELSRWMKYVSIKRDNL